MQSYSSYHHPYSWSRFGREGEFVIALYLKSRGWNVRLSKGSRGPADIIAERSSTLWLVQVKASTRAARLKGYEVRRLVEMADKRGGMAVIAILQPASPSDCQAVSLGRYGIFFYQLEGWRAIKP